ncbi:cytochrome c maturation protein CcmE [Desulfoplanes formicivorans]|uniref:Cytochrome C biogenesis protein CcmE n=1 Tax=Desulfoplanes formicivorans TaxID=1592317 RepID=A0A194AER0_9BACT|nr:cytochrome c maturation protein CcmE [Desulfoplanes formicivorans]GAU07680.1 cytochrome C biogenesis protein CcmE [Desulfoplanes formicivorans]
MTKQANQKWIYLTAFACLFAGIGYLLFSGLSKDSVYFLNVSEALAMDSSQLSQARLFGNVATQGLERSSDAMELSFVLVDKKDATQTLPVHYRGVVPDTFKPGVEVIVEGGLDPGTRVFKAKTLMTKCPSKYKKKTS